MNNPLFKIKDFRTLLCGQTIAVLGDWFGIIAVIALAGFRWNVTPVQMSMVVFALAAPMFFAGPLGGVIADRIDRARMMSFICVIRTAILIAITFLTNFSYLLVLLVFLGFFDASFLTAKNAKLKEIPPAELIDDAVIYSSFIDQGARVFGPALGGTVLAVFSIETALYINAAAYMAASIVFLFLGRTVYVKKEEKGHSGFFAEFKDGIAVMRTIPFITYGVLIQVFVIFVLQMVDSQFVILLRTMQGASEAWVGYCLMASGLGTFLTTFFYLRINKSADVKKSMFNGMLIYSSSVIGISLWGMFGSSPEGFIPFFLIWGASGALLFVKFTTYAQANMPVAYSGRVFGSIGSMLSSASMTGLFCGGILVSTIGAAHAFLFSGIMLFLGGLLLRTKKH